MAATLPTAGGITITALDTFQRESTIKTSIVRNPKAVSASGTAAGTIITIAASAFIFIVIVAWFAVLQAYIDTRTVNKEAEPLALSRLYFAIIATIISVVALYLFFIIYKRLV